MQMTVLTPRICALVPHSTRPFWHQWESSTQQQQPQPEQQQEQPKKSARRRLFQQEDTADEETNKQYVKRLLNDLSERYKQKWNFDFENDKPMEGQYQYDALPARQVPGFYRMVQHFDQPQSPARPNFFSSATAEQQQQQPSAERNENHWSPLLEQQAGNSSDLGDQPMEAGESKLTASALKSPSRVLRKARRSMQTPNKRNGQQAEDRGRGSHGWPAERQTKLTDFMSTRKGLARSVSKEFKEPQQQPMAVADSPTKRRRHSTLENGSRSPSRLFSSVDSPIKKGGQTRRSPRLHHARSALFK